MKEEEPNYGTSVSSGLHYHFNESKPYHKLRWRKVVVDVSLIIRMEGGLLNYFLLDTDKEDP